MHIKQLLCIAMWHYIHFNMHMIPWSVLNKQYILEIYKLCHRYLLYFPHIFTQSLNNYNHQMTMSINYAVIFKALRIYYNIFNSIVSLVHWKTLNDSTTRTNTLRKWVQIYRNFFFFSWTGDNITIYLCNMEQHYNEKKKLWKKYLINEESNKKNN